MDRLDPVDPQDRQLIRLTPLYPVNLHPLDPHPVVEQAQHLDPLVLFMVAGHPQEAEWEYPEQVDPVLVGPVDLVLVEVYLKLTRLTPSNLQPHLHPLNPRRVVGRVEVYPLDLYLAVGHPQWVEWVERLDLV